jgi:hypothetical protein
MPANTHDDAMKPDPPTPEEHLEEELPKVLARMTPDEISALSGEVAAIDHAGGDISKRLNELTSDRSRLENTIARRKNLARVMKALTLLGSALIAFGFANDYARHIGFLIIVVGIADLVLGNHATLAKEIEDKGEVDQMVHAIEEINLVTTRVLRVAGTNPADAIRLYADFCQTLQQSLWKKASELRTATREFERNQVIRLEVANAAQLRQLPGAGGEGPEPH